MSTETVDKPEPGVKAEPHKRRSRSSAGSKAGISMLAQGEPMIWLTGGALAICLLMILGLLATVIWLGMGTFTPQPVVQMLHKDGYLIAGEITNEENFTVSAEMILGQSDKVAGDYIRRLLEQAGGQAVLGQLPEWIQEQQAEMRDQIADIALKKERVEQLIDQGEAQISDKLAATQGGRGRVEDRMEIIRATAQDKKLISYRNDLQTLEGKVTSLQAQIDASETAIEFLDQPLSDEDGPAPQGFMDVLSAAPRQVKIVILNALLSRRAEQLGQDKVTATRKLVRIGNKQLTGETFRWVMDLEIEAEETTEPEWSIVVERQAWGRFFGQPKQFVVRHPRVIPGDEQRWQSIASLLEQSRWLTPEQQAAIEQPLQELRDELQAMRGKNVRRFLSTFEANDERQLLAVPRVGEPVLVADTPPDADVVEVREVWSGAEPSWQKYVEFHDEVLQRSDRRYELKKHDSGSISRQRQRTRFVLREEELEIEHQLRPIYREKEVIEQQLRVLDEARQDEPATQRQGELEQRFEELAEQARGIEEKAVNLVGVCTEIRQYEARRDALQDQIDANNALVEHVEKRFGKDSPLSDAATTIAAGLNADLKTEMGGPEEKLAELEKELSRAPQTAHEKVDAYFEVQKKADEENEVVQAEIDRITADNERYEMHMVTADQREKTLVLDDIVRAYPANQLSGAEKASVYASRWWEFLAADPREANSEGGVFPAIWGTVTMTLIMSIAVAPFGVLAALYLREYAKAGPVVSAVRISINNLAGVPSIVFGVFGLGFFCYVVGAYVDGGPENAEFDPWSVGKWYAWLAGLAVVAMIAFVVGLVGMTKPGAVTTRAQIIMSNISTILWIGATVLLALLIVKTPFFSGFYETLLPNPKFGKGGVLWASLTLALLTLPVVIVATEEALAAVPNSMREGSYGCGASKWQTIRRIVLPHAMPGIMTGMILAMARGAGEVAPLMLVGAVKLAPELPIHLADWSGSLGPLPLGPLHADRSFMHLGFHIFDLGFQSQDSEAAKPMVFTTTLLLISIIALLNIGAVWLRNRLRRRFQAGQF
jgi:ABC-type phosphate transport system permease subunit/ABC-type phosphate transport system auxiliary subunit